ncbi:MAG: hypothetical protein VYD19_08655, partial [Myxococcota bacterium]|nr:hypothetical protein [Myxococcota bacterium]
ADQCAWVSPSLAQAAVAKLMSAERARLFCEPCGEAAARAPIKVDALSLHRENAEHWSLKLNGGSIDLAYTYIPGENESWLNLGLLLQCGASGVSASLSAAPSTRRSRALLPQRRPSSHGLNLQNAGPTGRVTIKTEQRTQVMMIPHEEIGSSQYGWWSVWHERKERAPTFAPHTFSDLKPGKYVLIVYDKNGEASDGIVLEELEVRAGAKIELEFNRSDFTEWNCLSCPWLYFSNDGTWVRGFEILEDVVGVAQQTTRRYDLSAYPLSGRELRLQIREEKDEVTYLDQLILQVGDQLITPRAEGRELNALTAVDQRHVILRKGEQLELVYTLPAGAALDAKRTLIAHGYYEPEREMILSAYLRLTQRRAD